MDEKTVEEKQFFEEVEEDLKYKKMVDLWKKYGMYLVSFFALCLLGSIGNVAWTSYHRAHIEELTNRYMESLRSVENGDYESASAQLDYLKTKGGEEFKSIVLLQKAYVLEMMMDKEQDKKKAQDLKEQIYQTYLSIKNDTSLSQFFKDMVVIILVHGPFPEQHKTDIMQELERLSNTNTGYHYLALEAMMVLYGVDHNVDKMKEVAHRLIDDMQAPKEISTRAKAVIEQLDAQNIDAKYPVHQEHSPKEKNKTHEGEKKSLENKKAKK
jgi:hypothetical protein